MQPPPTRELNEISLEASEVTGISSSRWHGKRIPPQEVQRRDADVRSDIADDLGRVRGVVVLPAKDFDHRPLSRWE